MTKESVSILEGVVELSGFGLKVTGVIFVAVGILINIFLGLIIFAKLYGSEIALPIAKGIQIVFNGIFYVALIIAIIGLVAMILIFLIKHNEKFKEKRKKEFGEFVEKIIKKSRRKK